MKIDSQSGTQTLVATDGVVLENDKKEIGSGNIGKDIQNFFTSLFDVEKNPNLKAFVSFFQSTSQSKVSDDPEGTITKLENAKLELRNDPKLRETLIAALGGTGGAEEIAALMIKLSNMNRDQALNQRLQAHSAARSDLMGAAAEMKEAAVKQFAAAVVSAVITVVTSVISIGMSASSAADAKGALKDSKLASAAKADAKEAKLAGDADAPSLKKTAETMQNSADVKMQDSQLAASIGQNIGKLGGAGSELIGGSLQGAAKIDDSEGKMREASATDQQAAADVAKKMMEDLEKMVDATIQFLRNQMANEVELMSNFTKV